MVNELSICGTAYRKSDSCIFQGIGTRHTLSSSMTGHSNVSSYVSTNPLSLATLDTLCHLKDSFFANSAQRRDFPTPGVPRVNPDFWLRINEFAYIFFKEKSYLLLKYLASPLFFVQFFFIEFDVFMPLMLQAHADTKQCDMDCFSLTVEVSNKFCVF